MELTFATGNAEKLATAQRALQPFGHTVRQATLDLPEVQAMTVEEVATSAARAAARQVGGLVFVTDAGYFIEALGGFPGPLVKYFNLLIAEDMLALMARHANRTVWLRECLALALPDGRVVTFTSEQRGEVVREPQGEGSAINRVVRLEGFSTTMGMLTAAQAAEHWARSLTQYVQLAEFLETLN